MRATSVNGTSPTVYFEMKNKDSFKTGKDDSDNLGGKIKKREISNNPAPREDAHESDTTPPDHEVYVDLEPDELHLGDEEPEDVSK